MSLDFDVGVSGDEGGKALSILKSIQTQDAFSQSLSSGDFVSYAVTGDSHFGNQNVRFLQPGHIALVDLRVWNSALYAIGVFVPHVLCEHFSVLFQELDDLVVKWCVLSSPSNGPSEVDLH
jgi:hypothetical protein